MREICPQLSCECTEEEFKNGEADAYQTAYVLGSDGKLWKRAKLQGKPENHFMFEVNEIPGRAKTSSELKTSLSFLPAGKVPFILFQQIEAFFKKVMVDLGQTNVSNHATMLEAMAHILWNEEKGYFISIPTQKVSAASVSYENDNIEPGDMVVVDIHSHNSMDAFFSGTDNRDDKDRICISGVMGKLNTKETTYKFRFNYEHHKVELKMEDVFDVEKEEVQVPDEWLSKVSRYSYNRIGSFGTSSPYGGAGDLYSAHRGSVKKPTALGGSANQKSSQAIQTKTNNISRLTPDRLPNKPVLPVTKAIAGNKEVYLDSYGRKCKLVTGEHGGQPYWVFDITGNILDQLMEQDRFFDLGSEMDDALAWEGEVEDVSVSDIIDDLDRAALNRYLASEMNDNDGISDEEEEEDDDVEVTPTEAIDDLFDSITDDIAEIVSTGEMNNSSVYANETLMKVMSDLYDYLDPEYRQKIQMNGL